MAETTNFGNTLGWGRTPLLLVIDVTRAFTEPDRPLGSECGTLISNVNRVIAAARQSGTPIMYTRVAYDEPDLSDAGLWARKIGQLGDLCVGGTGIDIDPRLDFEPGRDPVPMRSWRTTVRWSTAGAPVLDLVSDESCSCPFLGSIYR